MQNVSVIIPTYNGERFISKTIQSVIDQTYKDWELIIVDDFSKDSTRELIEEWGKKDNRIISIFLNKNSGGPAHPKNIGFVRAKGKYIAYLDHDDEWLPNKLEKQIAILENDPNIGIISCEALMIDSVGQTIGRAVIDKIPKDNIFPSILFKDYIYSNTSVIIPREIIDKLGERDENPKIGVAEDREYELRVIDAGYKPYVIHEPLFKYRLHESNTLKTSTAQGFNYAETNLKYLHRYKQYNLEYLVWGRFAKEYLKIGDLYNSKKYCKITLTKRIELELALAYFLLFFEKYGMFICKNIYNIKKIIKKYTYLYLNKF